MSHDHKVCTHCGYIGETDSIAFGLLKAKSKCPKCANHKMVGLRTTMGHNVLTQKANQPRMWNGYQ